MSGSKLLRLCSLCLCLLLLVANFSVVANAAEAEENLVDSDLSNWVDVGESLSTFQSVDITSNDSNNTISVQSNSKGIAIIYDLTEFLKVGESYQFTFTLPNTNNTGLDSYSLKWYLANSVDGPVASESTELVIVNNTNKAGFLDKTTTYEFTYNEGYKNTCLALYIWGNDDLTEFPATNFYINDVSLIRVTTESEKKLDGILGWLQDIWNSLSDIVNELEDVWTNITGSITDLGDRISGFFTNLGDRISGFFTDLGDRISGFFTDLIDNVRTFFEELPKKIFNYEIEVTDDDIISDGGSTGDGEDDSGSTINLFSNLEFDSTKLLKITNYGDYFYIEFPRKTTSGSITKNNQSTGVSIERETDYLLSFDVTSYNFSTAGLNVSISSGYESQTIVVNDNGSYSVVLPSSPVPDTVYLTLSSYGRGLFYCNIENLSLTPINDSNTSSGDTGSDEEGTTTKVSWFQYLINKFKSWFNSIIDSVKGFFIKLVDDIKGLFIPPDGFFEEWKSKFDLMLSDNLGFIYQVPNFVIDIVEVIQEILQSDQEVNLVFPEVEFDIAGNHIELFKNTKVDFSFLEAGIWLTLYSMYKVMLYVIFAFALIKYGMSTWERTMSN